MPEADQNTKSNIHQIEKENKKGKQLEYKVLGVNDFEKKTKVSIFICIVIC